MIVRLTSALAVALCLLPTAVFGHAEHGHGQAEPMVDPKFRLPAGVQLSVAKSNVHQFVVSTDGQRTVEVIDASGRPYLKIQGGKVLGDANNPALYRMVQPGGGRVPEHLKDGRSYRALHAKWTELARQTGYGWYDARLVDESAKPFQLTLRVDGRPMRVPVKWGHPNAFKGYWEPQFVQVPNSADFEALLPGLTSGTLSLRATASRKQDVEVLDNQGKPVIRLTDHGVFVNSQHAWASQLGLYYETSAAAGWVKVSEGSMVTYQDPRLKAPEGSQGRQRFTWSVPVRLSQAGKPPQSYQINGVSDWKPAS